MDKIGPVYDPATGKRDEKMFNAAFAATARELWEITKRMPCYALRSLS
jgi:hypothetical protein